MCKITIATITYNREHLLLRTIKSVLNQTFKDFEYLIINNGSTDNTQSLIDQYCELDKRICVISYALNRRDPESSRNRYKLILANEAAPYFMLIDDDDFMEPGTVETLFQLITQYDADAASVGSLYVFPDGSTKKKYVFDGTYIFSRTETMVELLKREKFNASIGGKIFRKETLKDFTFPQVEISRDIHSGYRRMNNIRRMVVTGEPLFYFYRHDNNVSGLDTAKEITPAKMRQHLEANAIRTEWLTEHMPEIKDFVFYCELSFMISLYERIRRLDVQPCFEIAHEMKDALSRYSTFLSGCGFCTEREKEILNSMQIDINSNG